jgi:hypothetical protein
MGRMRGRSCCWRRRPDTSTRSTRTVRVLARHNLGDAVNDITLIEGANPLLAAACDDGYVYTLDRSLQPTRWLHAGDRALRTGTIDGPEGLRLLVATRENVLVVAP